eukprot:m.114678 g.114678  ORF g.114678 m.114678 type:complete len:252 (+) comp9281_c10_seq1:67-822(+)
MSRRKKLDSLPSAQRQRAIESAARTILFRCSNQSRTFKKSDFPEDVPADALQEAGNLIEEIFGLKLVELPKGDTKDAEVPFAKLQQSDVPKSILTGGGYVLKSKLKNNQRHDVIQFSTMTQQLWGLTMTILAFINIKEHNVSQKDLFYFLKSLGIMNQDVIDGTHTLDKYIDNILCTEQKYLVKLKRSEQEVDYRWGPRARKEISPKKISNFIKMVAVIKQASQNQSTDGVFHLNIFLSLTLLFTDSWERA